MVVVVLQEFFEHAAGFVEQGRLLVGDPLRFDAVEQRDGPLVIEHLLHLVGDVRSLFELVQIDQRQIEVISLAQAADEIQEPFLGLRCSGVRQRDQASG